MLAEYSFANAAYVTPRSGLKKGILSVKEMRHLDARNHTGLTFDLNDSFYVYPALINVHDHLRGNYLPRVGPPPGEFYLNWSPWDRDLKSSPVFKERANIVLPDAYLLGAYKNLFSGVVTVNDHFPHEFNAPFLKTLPLRAISNYALAHECSSFDLKWGDGIEIEHGRALKRNHPFITHLEEGYDDETQSGVQVLQALESLDKHTVLIHCIGFSDRDIGTVKKAGAHVVWCPASNIFMFNLTCKIRKFLDRGVSVSLGTDSTHTGSVNILEEMRYARETYRKLYGEDLPAADIFRMVTLNPAKAFRMDDQIGSIAPGKLADLLITRKKDEDPFESLLKTELEDIELILMEGTPLYGSPAFEELFSERNVDYTAISMKKKPMLVQGDPAGLLHRVRKAVGFDKKLDFMPLTL
jgi:5-methylthioadenosine/S-adenosylhomocysteine deaminase